MDRKDGVNSIETEIKTCDVTALGCTCDNERKQRKESDETVTMGTQIQGLISSLTGTSFMYHLVGDCRTAKEEENKGIPVSEISQ